MPILVWMAIFFISLTIPYFVRSIVVGLALRQRNFESDSNSLDKTAIELAFAKKIKHNIFCEIHLDEDLGPLDGSYNPILFKVEVGEMIAAGKRLVDIAEVYHELGHAHYYTGMDPSIIGKFTAEKVKEQMKIPVRSAIAIFLFIVMTIAIALKGYGYLVAAICGVIGILLFAKVLSRQFRTVEAERYASDKALEWMGEDGFSTFEIVQADKYLNSMLTTYKISIIQNITRSIFFVLTAMFGSKK